MHPQAAPTIARFGRHLRAISKARNTEASYVGSLAILDRYLRDNNILPTGLDNVGDVTPEMLNDFYLSLAEKGLGDTTRNGYVAAARKLFAHMVDLKKVTDNPAMVLKYIRIRYDPRASKRQPFTDDELLRIMEACYRSRHAKRNAAMIMMLLATALRVSELCSLNIADLAEIKSGAVWVTIKGGYTEEIAVAPFCILYLQQYLKTREHTQPDDPLFLTQKKTRMNRKSAHAAIKKIQGIAGIGHSGVHLFRHTTLTRVMKTDYLLARDVARHGAHTVTDKYGHTNVHERMEATSAVFGGFLQTYQESFQR